METGGTVKVPGAGPVKKSYVIAAVVLAGGYIGYRYWRAGSTPPAPVDGQLDTGSVTDSGVVGAPATGNTQYAGTTNPGSADAILTNDQWTAKAIEALGGTGWDTQTIASICGKVLADVPLTATEAVTAQAIIAVAGRPPVGDHPIRHAATSTPLPGPPPVPTGIAGAPVTITRTSFIVTFNPSPGATSYDGTLNDRDVKSSTAHQFPFSGLKPGTRYRVLVRAKNSHGSSPWGETYVTTKK